MLFIIIITVFITTGVVWSFKKSLKSMCFFLSSGYRLLKDPETALEILVTFHDVYPPIFTLPLSFRRCYFISKPEYFDKVFSSHHTADRPTVFSYLEELIGPNILNSSGSSWKKSRKILAPYFTQKSVDSRLRISFQEAENLAVNLAKQAKTDLDVVGLTSSYFIQVVCASLLGVESKLDIPIVRRDVEMILTRAADRGIYWNYQPISFMPSFPKECQNYLLYSQTVGKTIISEKRKQLAEANELINTNRSPAKGTKPTSIMENLLEHPEFTDERILGELAMLLVAGYETSTPSLLFIFEALALHPNIQERLYNDIVDICGTERPVTMEDLSRIEYADCVIKESLRLFPAVPIIGRYTQESLDIEIQNTGESLCAMILNASYQKTFLKSTHSAIYLSHTVSETVL
ncbi:unnamed protein product, partial [Callosobruchus maculatus]